MKVSSQKLVAALIVCSVLSIVFSTLQADEGKTPDNANTNQHDNKLNLPGRQPSASEIDRLSNELKSHLASNSVELNRVLEKSSQLLGDRKFAEADEFIRSARELHPGIPDLLVRHAEALAGKNHGSLDGEPFDIISRALDIDIRHKPSLWLMANFNQQIGNHDAALIILKVLKEEMGKESEFMDVVDRSIAASIALVEHMGAPEDEPESKPHSPTDKPALTLWISLAEAVTESFAPDDVVFVFARQGVETGQPLAVARRQISDFPTTVTLDDSMSMVPSQTLSSSDVVTVGARASRSGTALPYTGDWEGVLTNVPVDTKHTIPIFVDYELK
ncbi:MAG: tetratricopeptide repeat protein [Granulosicoccus sp.]